MDSLGTILPTVGATTGRDEWISLIGVHPSLATVPDRQGINPFTKDPYLFKAPRDSARVLVAGTEVGNITWAEDELQLLVVWSVATATAQVTNVAIDIASKLGWQFVPGRAA